MSEFRFTVPGFVSLSRAICFIPKADKHKSAPYKETPSLRSEPSEKPRESLRTRRRSREEAFPSLTPPLAPPTSVPPSFRFQVPSPAPGKLQPIGEPRPHRPSFLRAASPPAVTCPAPQPRDSNSRKRRWHRRCDWANASSAFRLGSRQAAGRRPRRLARGGQGPQPRGRAGPRGRRGQSALTSAGTQSLPAWFEPPFPAVYFVPGTGWAPLDRCVWLPPFSFSVGITIPTDRRRGQVTWPRSLLR